MVVSPPEVQMWYEGALESGETFWYDEDSEVTFTGPFARWRGDTKE